MHILNTNTTAITPAPNPMLQNVTPWDTNQNISPPNLTPLPPSLSPRQLTAISLLCAGHNLSHVAATLRISRMTLHRWRNQHPAFRAELARRQLELHDTASRRLRLTLLRALDTVDHQITHARFVEDRAKAAFALLRHLKLSTLLAPPAALTAAHCLDDLIAEDRLSRNLDPTLPITEDDRDEYELLLRSNDLSEPPLSPTHTRLAGSPTLPPEPYPAP